MSKEKAYFSISNQLKKLPQKIDTLAIVSIFLPESSNSLHVPYHVIPVTLCEAEVSAGNIIDPQDSLNIQMKHYVFGMRPYMFSMQFIFQNSKVHFRAIRKI